MFEKITPFKAFLGVLGVLGIVAAGAGFYGTFLILSGGLDDPTDPQVALLGDAACTDGELDDLETPYARGSTVRYASPRMVIENASVSRTADGVRLNATIGGRPIKAAGLRSDRTEIPVTRNTSERTVSLQADTELPVRVWIDATVDQRTVWTDLRICTGET
jgi:hypothetical protein